MPTRIVGKGLEEKWKRGGTSPYLVGLVGTCLDAETATKIGQEKDKFHSKNESNIR